MTHTEMLDTYEALSELTGTMLIAARRGEWDELTALEQHCSVHVDKLKLAGPIPLSESEQRAKVAIIRTILQNDARIRALAEPRLHELQERIGLARNGQAGARAYASQPR